MIFKYKKIYLKKYKNKVFKNFLEFFLAYDFF